MENEILIRLNGVSKAFDGETVLENVSLDIHDKEFVTLLGPSGCGKTTTLRIIGGFETPDTGDVIFDGAKINDVPPYKRLVNTVFQKYALFPHLNVYENIAFGLRLQKLPETEIKSRVQEMLALVNLKGFEHRKVTTLSGGQQQRVAIARALINRPRVLLLDEPLGALDLKLRKDMQQELKKIQKATGITFIFVTHDQEEAMSISDMIVVMKDGVVHQIGKPQEVYDKPANLFVAKFLGTPPINVFDGKVEKGRLYIGDNDVLEATGIKDGHVTVGVRPEGFIPDENGPLKCELINVEVMGRDTSVVFKHSAGTSVSMRAIVSAENKFDRESGKVSFSLKPAKTHIFDKDTEIRL